MDIEIIENIVDVVEVGSVVQVLGQDLSNDTFVSGEALGGHKLIYINNNKAFLASNNNENCFNRVVGFTVNSTILNEDTVIKRTGKIELTGWNLTPNAVYYLGIDGNITNAVPETGIFQIVGFALNENELNINIDLPIRK